MHRLEKGDRTIILNINSSQRTSGTNEDLKLNIEDLGLRNIKSWSIGSVSIPFSYYTVTSANNQLSFIDAAGPHTFGVAPQNYNTTTLATAIKTLMDSLGSQVYTVSYNSGTGKYTISAANLFTLDFTNSLSLARVLGFEEQLYTGSNSYTSVNVVNLSGPNNILITSQKLWTISNELSWTHRNGGYKRSDVIMNFLVNGDFRDIMQYYNNGSMKTYKANHSSIHTIDLQLRNGETYEVLDLNGYPWNIELVFHVNVDPNM